MKWDLFISHASEDKGTFVKPLVLELIKRNINVWYDQFSLSPGSSLKESIEKGIRDSDFGVVILSRKFFEKKWPKKELNAIFTKELIGDSERLIPIWYEIEVNEIFRESPMIADIVALSSRNLSIEEIARELAVKVSKQPFRLKDVKRSVNLYIDTNKFDRRRLEIEIFNRLDLLVNFENESFDIPFYDDNEWELFVEEKNRIREKYKFPSGLYEHGEVISKDKVSDMKRAIKKWLYRKNTDEEIQEFAYKLYSWYDIDMYYVLFGCPNDLRSSEISTLLDDTIFAVGRKTKSFNQRPELYLD